jgi:hypothetical protein
MITADRDLVPDDKWGYREALIDAFSRFKIYPSDVRTLSDDALAWRAPRRGIGAMHDLSFAALAFEGDPSRPAGEGELLRQARALGEFITRPENIANFGFTEPGTAPTSRGEEIYDPIEIESIRTARRVGPDGKVGFDLVAEAVQRRLVPLGPGRWFPFLGGTTVLVDPYGRVRYTVLKRPTHDDRLARTLDFTRSSLYWIEVEQGGERYLLPRSDMFQALHRASV